MGNIRTIVAAAAAVFLSSVTTAPAGEAAGEIVRAEILPGWQTPEGTQMAGLQIDLAPGWKTYWRAPGDAGVPPQFDWTGSTNVAAARVHWPRPQVFASNGLRTIGYADRVVLPIEFTPRTPGAPMDLHVRVELGVCEDICMPMELSLSARLPAEGDGAAIRAALDARPMTAREGRVGAVRCEVQPISDGLRLTAEIDLPRLGGTEAAVFELADPSIWVSEAATVREGPVVRARAELVPPDGAPFALDRSSVRITVLGETQAVDIHGCTGR